MNSPDRRLIALLADDDENDLILIRRTLGQLGFLRQIISVPTGEKVISYLLGVREFADRKASPFPDILILDQKMPGLSGLDTLTWIRKEPQFDRLPIVVFSLALSPREVELVHRLNAGWCSKMTDLNQMREAIKQAIEGALQKAESLVDESGRPTSALSQSEIPRDAASTLE
jgi:CheY-like chemotaxis protein